MLIRKNLVIIFFYFLNVISANAIENIAYIDMDFVLNNSLAGKSITKDLENINKINLEKLNSIEKNLEVKKLEIEKMKNISNKEKLENDIKLFNKEVEKFKIERDKLINDFKIKKQEKIENFLNSANPLIKDYMKENSIDILFEKKQLFIGNKKKDITEDIIKLINTNLKINE